MVLCFEDKKQRVWFLLHYGPSFREVLSKFYFVSMDFIEKTITGMDSLVTLPKR